MRDLDAISSRQAILAPSALEAEQFFRQYAAETGENTSVTLLSARGRLRSDNTYVQTSDELTYGARVAWRNALNCIGKAHWRTLEVIDARCATSSDDTFDACVNHLKRAMNGGRIRNIITVLNARKPGYPGIRIWNQQLVRYAGYSQADGCVIGDPETVGITSLAQSLGWRGNGSSFDVLPLIIQLPGELPRYYKLPHDVVLEIPLRHPTLPWFADLGLRWYAHPAISNQLLRIGGLSYTAAPFSGWYTCTEIAARNLSDVARYNQLPVIAERMGLDTRSDRTLWKDRALLELIEAVMHSYKADGVTIVDHHSAAKSFIRYARREERAGRPVNVRWRSLVAPTSASTTETFHCEFAEDFVLPNFLPQPELSDGTAAKVAAALRNRRPPA